MALRAIGLKLFVLTLVLLALAACGSARPTRDVGMAPANIDKVQTRSIFSLPRFGLPSFDGAGSGGGAMPASERQCRAELKRLNVKFTDIPAVRESANCGIDYPVKVVTLARRVELKPAATLNCQAALAAAQWFQSDAAPAARARYLSGVAEVRQMSSYSCRRIGGSGQWSEHSTGNALDIGAIKLNNGRVIDVAKPGFFSLREKTFLNNIRAGACDDFTTVLGPGSDSDHADHFHFDLRARKSGYRHCD